MLESASPAVDFSADADLITILQAIPDTRMLKGIRIPAGYLLLMAVRGILRKRERLRDLQRFTRRHHGIITRAH
jgi:hypothetical protein